MGDKVRPHRQFAFNGLGRIGQRLLDDAVRLAILNIELYALHENFGAIKRSPCRIEALDANIAVFILIRWLKSCNRCAEGLHIICRHIPHDVGDVRVLETIRQSERAYLQRVSDE